MFHSAVVKKHIYQLSGGAMLLLLLFTFSLTTAWQIEVINDTNKIKLKILSNYWAQSYEQSK